MNRIFLILTLLITSVNAYTANIPETLTYGFFGKINIYRPSGTPNSLVVFVSGDGGWNSSVINMVDDVVKQGIIVAGIDIRSYLKRIKALSSKCYYPASDFEQLSMMLQKKYKLMRYHKPILIGYSAGATLVYGMLAQAPANTFKGAIVFGFSPDIAINKPLCSGAGLKQYAIKEGKLYFLEASKNLTSPFIVLHGSKDKVCPYASTYQFMKDMPMGQLIELPNVGHDFSVAENWLPQFIDAFKKVLHTPSFAEQKNAQNALLQSQHLIPLPGDMTLTLIPSAIKDTLPMGFIISGDGGWTSFDHSLGESLAGKGIPVVGLDAQKYFWNSRTPEESALTMSKAIQHYMQQWNKKRFILVGYSFGACVAPFIANRFAVGLRQSLQGVYCLSPSETADFEIHISDMLSIGDSDDTYKVLDEVKKIKQLNPVCFFGQEEESDLRAHFAGTGAVIITLPGSHHYNNNTDLIAEDILKEIEKVRNK
jgi:type IV secretory pathway VirJ component